MMVGQVNIGEETYAVVNKMGYVDGIFARYILVPLSCIDKQLQNPVEVVDADSGN